MMTKWLATVCVAVACVSVSAQETRSARERDLLIGLDVGYSTAFREKSWVPVTVEIINEQRDFDGYIEVRTFDFSKQQQSPSYRMRAQCPQNSRKRFTLYAYLDGTDTVEVWLFEGGRRATDAPAYMQVRPIAKEDALILVLDEDPFNYGFLYAAIQREGRAVRLSRHGLPMSDLDRLPDIPQAYEAFDAVILGDIQPDRIAARHRALLLNYVEQGGTLVVSTGENAADYRGSWLEPLLGAEIGQATLTTEGDLAKFIPADLRDGLRPDRQAEFAVLTPLDGAHAVGEGGVLATRSAYGSGNIYTVAIDATSHALQDTPGYQALWRAILTRARADEVEAPELNIESFAATLAQALPNLSGVTIRPLGWVMTYLLLYLGIGVVANWIFWSRLKRREMAWVCLVGFSFAFTTYAMFFGRSGNLREAQQQSAGVLRIEPGATRAKFSQLTGILTARTRTFSGAIEGRNVVARDLATRAANRNAFTGMPGGFVTSRPFAWVQGDPQRIANFRVGASELRMVALEGEKSIEGAIDGAVQMDEEGVRGELVNNTGFALDSPMLVVDGVFIPVRANGNALNVSASKAEINRLRANTEHHPQDLQYLAYGFGSDRDRLWNGVRTSLFVDDQYQYQFDLPAYLVAWSDDALSDVGFRPDQEMSSATSRTLVSARVALDDRRAAATDVSLSVQLNGAWYRSRSGPPMRYNQPMTQSMPGHFDVQIPAALVQSAEGELGLELYWGRDRDDHRGILVPGNSIPTPREEDFDWHRNHLVREEATSFGRLNMRTTYRIEDWRTYLDERTGQIQLGAVLWNTDSGLDDATRRRHIATWGEFSVTAWMVVDPKQTTTDGAWPQWR